MTSDYNNNNTINNNSNNNNNNNNNNNSNIMAIAMSGKTARPCDCCAKKRARWYCAADDAFLCQSCDGAVHSANQLARRHERVRLKTASYKQSDPLPSWHRGLTKKPRTPRHAKNNSIKLTRDDNMIVLHNPVHMVPDLGIEESTSFSSSYGEDEEQLLFRVPVYDPLVTEFCTSTTSSILEGKNDHQFMINLQQKGYLPSDLELEEFEADVETLLGKGLDDEIYGIEELGLLDHSTDNNNDDNIINININIDDDEKEHDNIVDFGKLVKEENRLCNGGELIKKCDREIENDELGLRVPFELSFDGYDFPTTTCEYQQGHHRDDIKVEDSSLVDGISNNKNDYELCKLEGIDDDFDDNKEDFKVLIDNKSKKVSLRLDYEAISEAWASQGTPWMNGQRPEISLDDSWPHFIGGSGTRAHHRLFGETQLGGIGGNRGVGDEGREARVSRYREKRRTRLFSKKIRYEVRKLNAEKRPRMKGRFVKRSSFAPTAAPFPLLSKK